AGLRQLLHRVSARLRASSDRVDTRGRQVVAALPLVVVDRLVEVSAVRDGLALDEGQVLDVVRADHDAGRVRVRHRLWDVYAVAARMPLEPLVEPEHFAGEDR